MKAPDKIYYDKLCINPSGYEEGRAYELNPDPLPCVEYIRKDALMEWLDGKMTIEDETDGLIDGYNCAMKEVLNKINSM